MRFLFVYHDRAAAARDLLDRLQVEDVQLIVVAKGENEPPATVLQAFSTSGAPAAACQVSRKYRRALRAHVHLDYEPNEFRAEDRQLEEWLCPPPRAETFFPLPSESFLSVSNDCTLLIIADGALDRADDLVDFRRKFAANSAQLLCRFAKKEDVGPPRDWKTAHGVDFAPNGKVSRKCNPRGMAGFVGKDCEWHLKEGDRTTAASAARVYFDRVRLDDRDFVVVSYVGPHPADGAADAYFDVPPKG